MPLTHRCRTLALDGLGTQRVLGWAGLLLQETPDAVLQQRAPPASGGVYASYRFFGSPSSRYDLAPTSHIIEVCGRGSDADAQFAPNPRRPFE